MINRTDPVIPLDDVAKAVVVDALVDGCSAVGRQHRARHDVAAGYILSLTQRGTEEC